MTVSIHQPHFLPWHGYVNKALQSDVFVWLHSVQYRKNYFQNRTKIKGANGQEQWLTLPVRASIEDPIDAVTLADPRAQEKAARTLEQTYRRTPFYASCAPPILEALREETDRLEVVNLRTFQAMLSLLGENLPRIVRAGELAIESEDPTGRLVEMCAKLGATRYIAGKGGHNYLETEQFERAGIEVIWQEFSPANLVYPQAGGEFVPGLSFVDCLFNVGPEEARALVTQAWQPSP